MKILLPLFSLVVSTSAFADVKIQCNGSEPFWAASIEGSTLKFGIADAKKSVKLKILSTRHSRSAGEYYATVIKTKYASLSLFQGACELESGAIFSHQAILEINGDLISGCCDVVPTQK